MKVTVIGLGPGGGADLTGRARAALEACDLIVGYTAYIDLVRADFPQKETLSTGMRREVDRCRAAVEAARTGKDVAVVCSGDSGVYGMAGLIYEVAQEYDPIEIEVVPGKIEVLGRCQHNELPFPINRSREADETQRLKYRYLDLRNPAVKNNIVLRCQVVAALRAAMTEHGFLEITTPILTASSPEGARDYLVPARKHPGKFYALYLFPNACKG